MRHFAQAGLAIFATIGLLAAPAASAHDEQTGKEKLAKILEGRVAGEGRSCIQSFAARHMNVIDGTAVVFRDGNTLWVNIPKNAEALDDDDVWVTRQFGTQLCHLDQVTTHDQGSLAFNGIVMLGEFVPYRRASEG